MRELTHNQKIALEHLYNGKTFSWLTPAAVKRARSDLVKRRLAVKAADGTYTLTDKGRAVGREYRHYDWNPEIAEFARDVEKTHEQVNAICAAEIARIQRMLNRDNR